MAGPSREEGEAHLGRETPLAALGGVVLAIVMTWPLVLHLGSDIGKDLGDPLLQTWQVAWIGHALLESPLDLWQANTFWPYTDTLAFSDALVGYAPAGLVGQESPHAALVVYNLLFLGAYGLAFLGAYLLARELGVGRLGAVAAGVAFAYAPWKLAQNGHLHVLSSGGIPLALFLLLRGYRLRRGWLVLGGWLVAAWQMTLGFTLGLQFAYLLLVLGAIAVLALALRAVPVPDRRVMVATVVGVVVFTIAAGLMARPYLRVLDEHPEARRTPAYVESFSPDLRSFLSAPEQSWLWADAVAPGTRPTPRAGRAVALPRACDLPARPPRSPWVRVTAPPSHRAGDGSRGLRVSLAGSPRRLRIGPVSGAVPAPLRLRPGLGRRAHAGADQHADLARARLAGRGRPVRSRPLSPGALWRSRRGCRGRDCHRRSDPPRGARPARPPAGPGSAVCRAAGRGATAPSSRRVPRRPGLQLLVDGRLPGDRERSGRLRPGRLRPPP